MHAKVGGVDSVTSLPTFGEPTFDTSPHSKILRNATGASEDAPSKGYIGCFNAFEKIQVIMLPSGMS